MPPPEPRPGVARERTGLAWERSALAYATLGAVVLGVAAHRHAPGLLPVSAALAAVAVGVWLHGRRAYERTTVAPQPRTLGLMSVATGLAAVAAVIAVIARL